MSGKRPHGQRIAFAVILVLVLAQVGTAAYAIAGKDILREPETPIRPVEDIVEPLDLEAANARGLAIARSWQDDAVLVNASMQVDWPDGSSDRLQTELPHGGWVLLSYLSGEEMLALRMDRGSGVVVETEVVDMTEGDAERLASQAIDFERASTSSSTAVLAAEATYGLAFRSACPERRRSTWISVHPVGAEGQSTWFVSYEDSAISNTIMLSVEIDWETGNVIDVVNLNSTCD